MTEDQERQIEDLTEDQAKAVLQKMASGEFRKSYSMDSTSQEWREGYNQAVEDYRAMLLKKIK